jgi:hypothetical protein
MPRNVPVAAGYNNLPNGYFIPEVWSRKLQAKFYATTVFGAISNNDWEGEIQGQGSKVIIRKRPTIVVSDYQVGGTINYQDLTDEKLELLIDKAKVYAFKLDDIDKAQTDINVIDETTLDAAEQTKITIDIDVLANIYTDATSSLSSTVVTKTNVLEWIVDAGTELDQLNVPVEGRWLVITPWIAGMIKKGDLKDASLAGDLTSVIRNGRLGMIDRFMIYVSNNIALTGVAATGTFHCLAGTRDFVCFASQFVKTETIRLQDTFGDAIRGLNVYGYKVTHEDSGVYMPAKKA